MDGVPAPTLADFPAQIREGLRYADTDRQGHVNNAVFATLFESGRVAILYDRGRRLAPTGGQFVIAALSIRFLGELHWPGTVTIGTALSRLGCSSLTLSQGIFLDHRCMATAESVLVLIDEATRKSTPLPEATRRGLEPLRRAPEDVPGPL